MIRFTCSNCGRHISVDDKYSGRKGKCPKCGKAVHVPRKPSIIIFNCESCDQEIRLSQQYCGKTVHCPKCGNEVIVPSPDCERAESDQAETAKCPICDQVINSPAGVAEVPAKCPQCGCRLKSEIESAVQSRRLRFVIGATAAVVVIVVIAVLALILPSESQLAEEMEGRQVLPAAGSASQPAIPDTDTTTGIADSPGTYISVDIEILSNGEMLISEQQRCSINTEQSDAPYGRYRWLSMDRIDFIKDIDVFELARNAETLLEPVRIPTSIDRNSNSIWINWQHKAGPMNTLTFLVRYRVVGGLRVEQPNDELNWEAVYGGRSDAIDRARVRVHLPPALHGTVRRATSEGCIASLNIAPDGSSVEFNSLGRIPANGGLRVIVAFPHELLKIKSPHWQPSLSLWSKLKKLWAHKRLVVFFGIVWAIFAGIEFLKRMCPECGKMWGLKYTGEKDRPDTGKWWYFPETMLLYRCRRCGHEEWRKRASGGC